MTALRAIIMSAAVAAGGCSSGAMQSPQPGTMRTDLQRHDLSAAGWEVVQVRVDFAPGFSASRHRHPGEEVIYVLEGDLEYHVEGQPPAIYRLGDVLTVPAGAIHWVRNVGGRPGAELATYIVAKGKPLIELTE